MKIKLLLWATAALLILPGATCLPAGKTEGPIVANEIKKEHSPRSAENYAATSLFSYASANIPGQAVAIEAEESMLPLARRIIEGASLSGIHFQTVAPNVLKCWADVDNIWAFELYRDGSKTPAWKCRVQVVPEESATTAGTAVPTDAASLTVSSSPVNP